MSTRRNLQKIILFCISLVLVISFFSVSFAEEQESLFAIEDYFDVASMNVADMTKDGEWLVCTVSTRADRLPRDNFRYGDPTYIAPFQAHVVIVNTKTGKQKRIFSSKQQVRSLTWSPDGQMLAFFILKNGECQLTFWNRTSGKSKEVDVSKHGSIASNSHLIWSPNGKKIYFAIRAPEWKKKSAGLFKNAIKGPVIIHDSEKPFLLWDEIRRRNSLKIPVAWDRTKKKLTKLLPETPLLSFRLSKDGTFVVFERDVTEKTSYEVIFGTMNQLEVLPLVEGSPRVLLKKYQRRRLYWNKENTMLAYAEKGDVYVMDVKDEEPRNLTGEKEEDKEVKKKTEESKDEEKVKEKKQRFSVMRFSPDGSQLLCSSSRPMLEEEQPYRQITPPPQFWLVDVKTSERQMIYESSEDPESRPTLRVMDWSPSGSEIYFSYSAPDKYDRGLVKLDLETQKISDLVRSDHRYRSWRMSEDGQTFIFTDSDGDFPSDWYTANLDFSGAKKLTDLNPQLKDKALSHTELISYRDADGKKLYGVLFYPANYEKGKKYPLITEVYERYFDNGFNSTLNIFTSAGYAVLHPSVRFNRGYPGEAWAKGALSAINKVIEMGVADPERLGIQGTSYGGYATVLLITQTDRFKAAINNSGKVDMISFYTQSPRIGVRNIHAPERSQDRIGGTMWEYPERYLAHSAILHADRIKTPLLCITGDQDPNVEGFQSQEIYYALRRLDKKVVWLRYHNGAHGGPQTNEERKDMYKRMIEWYDKYLKADKGEAR